MTHFVRSNGKPYCWKDGFDHGGYEPLRLLGQHSGTVLGRSQLEYDQQQTDIKYDSVRLHFIFITKHISQSEYGDCVKNSVS